MPLLLSVIPAGVGIHKTVAVATENMKHSNRNDLQKQSEQATQPVKFKQKTGLFSKLRTGCCLIGVAILIAGTLYIYKFYDDVKAELDAEINQNKELYEETKETIDKANKNYREINSAVEQGKEYLDKAEDLRGKVNVDN